MSQQLKQKGRCPRCGSSKIVRDLERGEIVCNDCGLVLTDEVINRGPEWRAFTFEEKQSRRRVGPPSKYSKHDKGLSTVIKVSRDAQGRPLSSNVKHEMWRLSKLDSRSKMLSKDRNLAQAMSILNRMSDKINIPHSIKEEAALIYRRALDAGLVRGRSIAGITAAALYAACRISETPRSLKDIAKVSQRDVKEIARDYRLIVKDLKIKMPIDKTLKYTSKIASKAGLKTGTELKAISLLRIAREKKATTGKHPKGLAAAALYLAARLNNEKISQRDLANAADVTEVTVRNRLKGLREVLKKEIEQMRRVDESG
jgi:transcription initiation factor TFIIB